MFQLESLTTAQLLAPANRTASATATAIDLSTLGIVGNLLFVQKVGTTGGTSPTLDGVIQDSADNSTFANIGTFTQVTTSTGTLAVQSIAIDSRLARRYVRHATTFGGTSPTFACDSALIYIAATS